jgi:glucuronosyltransferase
MAVSRAFRDRPVTPLNTAIFWTEYVIRHRGAPHMRSAALELSWYLYILLDVIAVLFVIAAAVLITLHVVFKRLLNLVKSKLLHSKAEIKKTN